MATDTFSDEQNAFKKEANKYGIKAFSVDSFKKDKELQKAFKSFIESDKDELMPYWKSFLEAKSKIEFPLEQYVMDLFNFSNKALAKKIACMEYYEIETTGHIAKTIDDDYCEDTTIANKINDWKTFCNAVDDAKEIVDIFFPNWNSAIKDTKKTYISTINKLTNLHFTSKKYIKYICYFLKKYDLHQHKKAKIDKLLEQNLPNIEKNEEIARKIVYEIHNQNKEI